jgi:hypothetical protein
MRLAASLRASVKPRRSGTAAGRAQGEAGEAPGAQAGHAIAAQTGAPSVPDLQNADQVDGIAGGAMRNLNFDSDIPRFESWHPPPLPLSNSSLSWHLRSSLDLEVSELLYLHHDAVQAMSRKLANVARVSAHTVTRFEGGAVLKATTVEAIQDALEKAGVVFIGADDGGPGARLSK